ncbi:YkgJ family cysteine cluster protein [Brevundimonas sp.]|uniref:YkgJ family cysteine cluster protein n=1 Tax=Brevundimonas sp. TaxID=1871086 RepID=UPI002CB39B91|nr:YkgJ family cysteine cluster protein [Brevundimonas sp.]HWQ85408.1 YkgJ family cysteine cluster protein [Brevundimonas sp.]
MADEARSRRASVRRGTPPQRVDPDEDAVVRLLAIPPDGGATTVGRVMLEVGGERIPVEMTVPAGPVAVEDLLPIVHGLSSLFATRATARVEAEGREISCRAGCGACCRQLVPVAPAEARALARLVEAMPEPRRERVRRRFDAALDTLEPLGLMERLDRNRDDRQVIARDYFAAGVACPFLEDEACSIHADRPLSCREYLVTSPPDLCAALAPGIEKVTLEARPSLALLNADLRDGWLPLVLSLVQHAQAPPSPRDRPAADILKQVVGGL